MTRITLIVFVFLASLAPTFAESIIPDSIAITTIAKKDAGHFKYKWRFKLIKENYNNPGSDYFKPTSADASQQSLLSDSLYVKTFKYYAIKKVKRQRLRTGIIIAAGVTGFLIVLGIEAQRGAIAALTDTVPFPAVHYIQP
jgi:hypothetical protein